MSALAGVAPTPTRKVWTSPLAAACYDRRAALSAEEHDALELVARCRYRWPKGAAEALERLTGPIDDVLDFVAPQAVWWGRSPTRGELLLAMRAQRQAFWGWEREQWIAVLSQTHSNVRQLVAAVAYLLCEQRDLHREFRGFKAGLFARRVFGAGPVEQAVGSVEAHLDGFGPAAELRRPHLQHALYQLMLSSGSPLLVDLGACGELLAGLRSTERHNGRRHGVEQLARTLVAMGVLERSPFGAQPTREEWLARSRAGDHNVPGDWLEWTRRWFSTSTLSHSGRARVYYTLIKAGRWLAREHPDRADPRSWTRELAAAWVAAVDQMAVGDFSRAPNTESFRAQRGGPLGAGTKAQHIGCLATFFCDLQEWE